MSTNEPSPDLSPLVLPGADDIFLGRQPILDAQRRLAAFELLFRSSAVNRASVVDDVQATAHVLARTFGEMGIEQTLGPHVGYLNVTADLLFSDLVDVIPPERFVLEVLETVQVDDRLVSRLTALRRRGYRLALDDVIDSADPRLAMLPCIDIVKIDLMQCPRDHWGELVALCKRSGKTLLAEKVETTADFDTAKELGFDLFQGYFFTKPEVLKSRRSSTAKEGLLRLLTTLSGDPDAGEIAEELKTHPFLTTRLLQLCNSSARGLSRRIDSIRDAVLVLGTAQIVRWVQLLLYADLGDLPMHANPLLQLVVARARFMELAAKRWRPDDERLARAAFMTGILSLLDVLLSMPIAQCLDQLPLTADVRSAILRQSGDLGLLLKLAQAKEAADEKRIGAVCSTLSSLTPIDAATLDVESAVWTVALTQT